MKTLSVEVTDKQYDLFRRMAISERKKLNVLVRLVFARGLEFEWCEDHFTFSKKEDEFTSDEKKQIAKNEKIKDELEKKGKKLYQLSTEEETELGYKYVAKEHFVGGYGDDGDIAHLLAEQLREPLLDKETGNYVKELS